MALDDWFAARYALARERVLSRLLDGVDPLLIRVGAELVLLHQGRRRTETVLEPPYERAKAVCHAPAAVYLLLHETRGGAMARRTVTLAQKMKDELQAARDAAEGPEAEVLARCVTLLEAVLAQGHVTPRQLAAFGDGTEGPMRAVIRRGTEAYLTRLDEVFRAWSRDWDETRWRRALVVICAGHAPRYKESTQQYFRRRFGEEHGEGAAGETQVLYAEGADDERAAVELAASHLLNRELGRFFKGSPVALQEDVLGDAARAVLDELLPLAPG